MFLADVLFAMLLALLLTFLFVVVLRWRGPWPGFLAFLAVLFLATWAGGVWIRPAGPLAFGLYWVPFIITALVVALLLAAAGPPRRSKIETIHQVKEREQGVTLAINHVLWSVIAVLAILIAVAYVSRIL